MQKQEIPPFTLCHSRSDLALNQLAVLQAISRPPRRLHECSLNSRGPSWTSLRSPLLMGGRSLLFIQTGRSFHAVQIKEQSGRDRCVCSPLLWAQEGLVPLGGHCDGPSCVSSVICARWPPKMTFVSCGASTRRELMQPHFTVWLSWLQLRKDSKRQLHVSIDNQFITSDIYLSRTKWQRLLDPAYQTWGFAAVLPFEIKKLMNK